MKNILITGGAGFIGSNFARHLLQAESGVRLVNLDVLTYAGNPDNLANLPAGDRHSFVKGDICDARLVEQILREHQIDTVVHFAAETHVDRSLHGAAQFVQTNVMGTLTLLEAVRKFWLTDKQISGAPTRFHHVSTDEVYGTLTADAPAFVETTPYDPSSPYSASKAASDHFVRAYARTFGLPVTISNCSNNYGPYQFPEKLIPLMILHCLEGKPLPVYGDGRQIRDWLYVEDHCEAIRRILQHGRAGETYNIGGDNQPSNLEIVGQICALMDELRPQSPHRPHSSLIKYVADRPGHDRRYAIDISKIRLELGWRPLHPLPAGLRQTVVWYLEHADWLASIRSGNYLNNWLNLNYEKRGTVDK